MSRIVQIGPLEQVQVVKKAGARRIVASLARSLALGLSTSQLNTLRGAVDNRSDLATHVQDVVTRPYVNVLNYDFTPGVRTKWRYTATEPSHAMKEARLGGGWWEIEPEVVNLRHFGSLPDEGGVDAVFASAADYVKYTQRGEIVFPDGRFYVEARLTHDFLTTIPANQLGSGIRIQGPGRGGKLLMPTSNTDGLLTVNTHHNVQNVEIENISVGSQALIGTIASPTNGNVINLICSVGPEETGWGTPRQQQCVIRGVRIAADRPGTQGRISRGIYTENFWYPQVTDCWVETALINIDTDANYETGAGYHFRNCYSALLRSLHSLGKFSRGMVIDRLLPGAETWDFEDLKVTECQLVNGEYGLYITHIGSVPNADPLKKGGGMVALNHINGHHGGIYVKNHRQLIIALNHFLATNSANYTYADEAVITLEACRKVRIANNIADENGHYTSNSDTTAFCRLKGDTRDCSITDNEATMNGVVIRADSTIGDSNYVTGNKTKAAAGSPSTTGPTKVFVDASGKLRGGDIRQSFTPDLRINSTAIGSGNYDSRTGWWSDDDDYVFGQLYIDLNAVPAGTATDVVDIDLTGLPVPATSPAGRVNMTELTGFATAPSAARMSNTAARVLLNRLDANLNIAFSLQRQHLSSTSIIEVDFRYARAQV